MIKYMLLFILFAGNSFANTVIIGSQIPRNDDMSQLPEYNTNVNARVQTNKPVSMDGLNPESERTILKSESEQVILLSNDSLEKSAVSATNNIDEKTKGYAADKGQVHRSYAGDLGGVVGYEYTRIKEQYSKRVKVGVDGYLYFQLKKGFLVDNIKSLLSDTYAVDPVFKISKNHLVYADMWVKGRTTLDLIDEILVSYTKPFPIKANPYYNRVVEVEYDEKN